MKFGIIYFHHVIIMYNLGTINNYLFDKYDRILIYDIYFMMIALYYQAKIPIDFSGLNFISFIR